MSRRVIDAFVARHGLSEEVADLLPELAVALLGENTAFAASDDGTLHADDDMATYEGPRGDLGPYDDLGEIGRGGMAEVRRVRDPVLNRVIAMKIIHPDLVAKTRTRARFVAEAQATAQLDHPGIVPVHELGALPDGRMYFTMKEVVGRTLEAVVKEIHDASTADAWRPSATGWTFRRLIQAFRTVCDAVAYAHAHGIVHRDLKPANVMLGAYGEVLVVDWGLAKVVGVDDEPEDDTTDGRRQVVTDRSRDPALATRHGAVSGTPAYMSPEQARGDLSELGPAADVYALGATLYFMLSGRPPFSGQAIAVIQAVRTGPPTPLHRLGGPPIPPEIRQICERAMERDPDGRYDDAGAMAEAIGRWLDGAQRRDQALAEVAKVRALLPEIRRLRDRGAALRAEASALLAEVPATAPEADKIHGWSLEDAAADLDRRAEIREVELTRQLQAALTQVPDLREAHVLLAMHYRAHHEQAEAARDATAAAKLEILLRAHDTGAHAAYLEGTGAVTLVTDPPGADVMLHRYVLHHRRLVPEPVRRLGRTPVIDLPLARGSYLLEIRCPGRRPVHYPVLIRRLEHWDGVRPGDSAPHPVYLPRDDELGPDDLYVPAGFALLGGDPQASNAPDSVRPWVDGFAMRRFPVTNADYIAFLDALVAAGRESDALTHAPRERAGKFEDLGPLIYGRTEAGGFELVPDADGDVWAPDWPVLMVQWFGARAYTAWMARQTGIPWRLPYEAEWEKAARGVDGRFFPWGDFMDPPWSCNRDSGTHLLPQPVDSYPVDTSPYGVRGLGGNMKTWCLDPWGESVHRVVAGIAERFDPHVAATHVFKGGAWSGPAPQSRGARRDGASPYSRYSYVGFRLVRPMP